MWSIASFECTVAILNNCIGGWFSLKFFLRHNKKSACNVPNSVLTSFFPLFACPRYLSFTIRFVFIVNIYLMYGALWSIYIDIKPSRRNFDCQEQSIVSRRTTCEGRMAWLSITSNGSWCMGIKGDMSGTVCVTFKWDTYIYIWVVYSLCFFCCLFITVTWWYVWCFEWASGNQEEVQACLVTLWLFIISCYSLYKTTLGLLCSWFENNPHFHKYSMDSHV